MFAVGAVTAFALVHDGVLLSAVSYWLANMQGIEADGAERTTDETATERRRMGFLKWQW
jgi:hypothetical protein